MAELKLAIEWTRGYLNCLLQKTDNPVDPYVVFISQELDKLLNMYYRV